MTKNGFVKKNVGTLTLGERLVKIRGEKRITLSEISRSTRIQMKYLEYLESGQYDKLPVDVYVRGFLRSYAQYLGVDEKYLIKLYDREKEIHNNVKKEEGNNKRIFKPVKFSSLVVTPKTLIAFLIIFFVGLGFFYLYRELSIFISNPRLVITDPVDNFSTEDNVIKVEGITEKDARLTINEQQVIVDENGKFSQSLVLQSGINKITIKAVNRFDKESERVIAGEAKFENIVNAENTSDSQNQEENQEIDKNNDEMKVKVDVYGDTKSTSIIVKADDVQIFSGVISPEDVKNFEAKEKVTISAGKGKYVGVKLNGKDLGTLSKDTKPISRVFTGE